MITIQVANEICWPLERKGHTVTGKPVSLDVSPEISNKYNFIVCGPQSNTPFLDGMWSVWNLESNALMAKGVTEEAAIKLAECRTNKTLPERFDYLVSRYKKDFDLYLERLWEGCCHS